MLFVALFASGTVCETGSEVDAIAVSVGASCSAMAAAGGGAMLSLILSKTMYVTRQQCAIDFSRMYNKTAVVEDKRCV